MCLEDFVKYYDKLYFCKPVDSNYRCTAKGEWKADSAGGCVNNSTWRNNPQFMLEVTKDTSLTLVLEQETKQNMSADKLPSIGLTVLPGKGSKNKVFAMEDVKNVFTSTFTNATQVTLEVTLSAELSPWFIMPSTYAPGVEANFCITVFGYTGKINSVIEENVTKKSLRSAWTSSTSGGCKNHTTWRKNPTFLLKTHAASEVVITLAQSQKSTLYGIGVYLFNYTGNTSSLDQQVGKSSFIRGLEVSMTLKLDKPSSVIVLPCTLDPAVDSFNISAFSSSKFTLNTCPL